MSGSEFAWIARIAERLEGVGGREIGDDAAVLDGEDASAVWTIDALVEHVHFRFDWLSPSAVGYRALVASLSDIAAMGARPRSALIAVALPAPEVEARLSGLYDGIGEAAARFGCEVIGGDLSRADRTVVVTTVLGRCEDGPPLRRSGVTAGDELWLTGALGAPAASLALLAAGTPPAEARATAAFERLARPCPRIEEVRWLRRFAPVAAIDLSDGLSSDAGHLARASGVGVRLDAASIPIHPDASRIAAALGADASSWALHGGEEFELLLAVRAGAIASADRDAFESTFDTPLTPIGVATEDGSVSLVVDDGPPRPLVPGGWDHFAGGCEPDTRSIG